MSALLAEVDLLIRRVGKLAHEQSHIGIGLARSRVALLDDLGAVGIDLEALLDGNGRCRRIGHRRFVGCPPVAGQAIRFFKPQFRPCRS